MQENYFFHVEFYCKLYNSTHLQLRVHINNDPIRPIVNFCNSTHPEGVLFLLFAKKAYEKLQK
jgi:hypothetical protein